MDSAQKRAFLAIILSGIVLFAWQFYFAPKDEKRTQNISSQAPVIQEKKEVVAKKVVQPKTVVASKSIAAFVHHFDNDSVSYDLDSTMFLTTATNKDAKFSFEQTLGNKNAIRFFAFDNGEKKEIHLSVLSKTKLSFSGVDNSLGVNVVLTLQENGFLAVAINSLKPLQFAFELSPKLKSEDARLVRQFAVFSKEVDRFDLDDEEADEGSLQWFGIDFNYHLVAVTFPNKTLMAYDVGGVDKVVRVKTINPLQQFSFSYIFTDKNYDKLGTLGNKLDLSVDYGVFGILAVPILKTLQFIHKYIPNYGVAIIILTLILRLLLYPLQVKSFKSMKKMQQVQPEVKLIKEKFKDDPKRQQQETMALFKRAGANPLGGCLPLLLQMPFFFAIFQVLRNSIELVDAPFFGWITDLSVKDPYYVLPILMCLAMIVQQKVTPSPSADPTQKKMMMIMPLVFGFIMKDLPSGLCLYIFISTLFGFAQQMLVYKFSN